MFILPDRPRYIYVAKQKARACLWYLAAGKVMFIFLGGRLRCVYVTGDWLRYVYIVEWQTRAY